MVALDVDLEPSKPEAGETSLPARKGGIGEPRVWSVQSWHCLDQPAGLSQVETSLKPSTLITPTRPSWLRCSAGDRVGTCIGP